AKMGACVSTGASVQSLQQKAGSGGVAAAQQHRTPLPRDSQGRVDLLELLKRPPTPISSGPGIKGLGVVAHAALSLEGFVRRQPPDRARLSSTDHSGMPCLLLSTPVPSEKQEAFATKVVETRAERGLDNLSQTVGYACTKGKKLDSEMPNQDHFVIAQANRTGVYGVFDGHGPKGHSVSSYAASKLLQHMFCNPLFK
ncbi:unnamed protein product, partial [Polarella glacialis]